MKMSEVFLRAAELVSDGTLDFCCIAIDRTTGWFTPVNFEAIDQFKTLFYEGRRDVDGGWFGTIRHPDNQSARILALCFAAAIAESEGL